MRVTYINQTGQLGGGELAILPWLQHEAEKAHVILFEDGPFRQLLESADVEVELLSLRSVKNIRRESGLFAVFRALPGLVNLRSVLRSRLASSEILYANSQKAFFLSAMSKRSHQPLIWHLRDIMTGDHFSRFMRKLAVWMGNRYATHIIANSHATSDAFVANGGLRRKVTVVHDGVSGNAFAETEGEQKFAQLFRREHSIPEEAPLVGVFGRLSEWKGQHVLLQAMANLPNAHAVLVGDAMFGEHAYVEKLRMQATALDVVGRIHFLGFRRDIPELMKAMTVIVHTSIAAEPFGLVIVEGMLACRPVIATRAGGALEIIVDGVSGILVTPGNSGELDMTIRELLTNPERARTLAEAGRERALATFSVEALFSGIEKVLYDVEKSQNVGSA